jgi:hypothetical protein
MPEEPPTKLSVFGAVDISYHTGKNKCGSSLGP